MHGILFFYHIIYIRVKLNDPNDSVLSTVGLMWDTAKFFLKHVLDALLCLMWVILKLLVQFNMAQVNFQKRTK